MSTVSDTDVKLFLALSNPETTNSSPPNMKNLQTHAEDSDEEQNSESENEQSENDESDDDQSENEKSEEEDTVHDTDPPPLLPAPIPMSAHSQGHTSSRVSFKQNTAPRSDVSRRSSKAGGRSQVFHEKVKSRVGGSQLGASYSFSNPPSPPVQELSSETVLSSEELLLEKQSVLLELERLKTAHGITLTRNYTLNDRLDDMQFEVRRHLLNIEEANMLNFMRDGMKLAFTGIELANSKLGPFLELDGWAGEMCQDIHKYDNALGRLYKKYWRKSSMSPEMELACGILGSLGMHHFKKKVMPSVLDPGFASQFMPKMGESSRSQAHASRFEEDDEQLPAAFL